MSQLSLIDKAFVLKKTALFQQLDLDLLLNIADRTSAVDFERSDSIFQQGGTAHRLYVVVQGRVSIRNGKDSNLAQLGRHDFFGDEALFNEQSRQYSAICLDDTRLLSLSRSDLLTIINESPSVAVSLLQAYASLTDFRQRP